MKTLQATFLSLLLLALACGKNATPELQKPTAEDVQFVRAAGDSISAVLLKSLQGTLKQAIGEGDFVNAISVCNIQALPLTQKLTRWDGYRVRIKRVTGRTRNPANAPDAFEQKALDYFQQAGEELPAFLVQKITAGGERVRFRYYKPLKVGGLCVNCHGPEEMLQPQVRETLQQLYPNDRATGYAIGDFRGLVRVELQKDE